MPPDQFFKRAGRFFLLILRRRWINDSCIQDFSRIVYHRDFAASTIRRIQPQRDRPFDRRLQEKLPQIRGKNLDGLLRRPLGQHGTDFPLQ